MEEDRASCGVVYYAIGRTFVDEALVSAESVRRAMPDLPLAIYTEEPIPDGYFDMRLPTDPALGVKGQKMACLLRSPFSKTLYLDTDTYMVAPVPELFDMLDDYDLAISLSSPGRLHDGWDGVPLCFPVLNSGVIAFRRCEQVSQLFDDWLELHGNSQEMDQPPLRQAIYRSRVRWAPISSAYNLKFDFPQLVMQEVKILHARHPDLAAIGRKVQPLGTVMSSLPVGYIHRTRVLGRKTPGPRKSELFKEALKLLGRRKRH